MTTSDGQAAREETLALLQKFQTLLSEQRFDEWIDLWADDGVCEYPYAAEGRPRRLVGKDEIYEHMKQYPGRVTMHGIDEFRLHLGSDPNVAVVEMTIRATATETGRPYNQQLVLIAETKDGKVTHYREYWNPLIWAEAFA
jgi:ketosteroid isomerase-like protein